MASLGGGSTTSPGLQDEESIESKADASVKETASHSGKAKLHAESKTGSQPHIGLGIDSISTLMFHHPTHQVAATLRGCDHLPLMQCVCAISCQSDFSRQSIPACPASLLCAHAECMCTQVLEWVDDVLQQPALSCLAGTLHTVGTHPICLPYRLTCRQINHMT